MGSLATDASIPSQILEISFLYAAHCLIPGILLISTSKRSIWRYISIPVLALIAHRFIRAATSLGPGFIWCELARLIVTVVFQSLNLLLINPKDNTDLPQEIQSLVARIYYSTRLFTQPRGINTPWQIKNAPAQPAYYAKRGMNQPPRGRFLLRNTAIAVWQYLALDVFATLALQQAREQEESQILPPTVQWDLSVEQWIERIISNLVAGFVVSRLLIDFHHRAFSILIVGLGLDSPSNCPPLFGRAADAGSLRGFWGYVLVSLELGIVAVSCWRMLMNLGRKFWHQLVREPFVSVGTFITRDILGLSKPPLERYTNIFLVFLFSGGLHVILDVIQGIPGWESGAMLLFMTAPLGLVIEDSIKALWRSGKGINRGIESADKEGPPIWQKVLGFVWAMAWLGITSTWYFYPQMLRPENQALVPYSFASHVGLPAVAGAVLAGGALVAYVFEVEV
ncbi:hypothetical protein N7466_008587 [Penicillium verhagenii]|uniref:uncharacterized protein n=1 Tax=Penicillium verhagenii TaxID=1562060 RepID=UPI00254501EE|nr:uncharacterized protein N7466_008587 [Penicillium verhagenii]KAJ5924400.1 hypothetical protein N7466_008587 [Penicillium verhagenii]